MSDQAALPNLNANWVNAKGESLPCGRRDENKDGCKSRLFKPSGFEKAMLINVFPKVPGRSISFS